MSKDSSSKGHTSAQTPENSTVDNLVETLYPEILKKLTEKLQTDVGKLSVPGTSDKEQTPLQTSIPVTEAYAPKTRRFSGFGGHSSHDNQTSPHLGTWEDHYRDPYNMGSEMFSAGNNMHRQTSHLLNSTYDSEDELDDRELWKPPPDDTKFLQEALSQPLTRDERKSMGNAYPYPDLACARMPKLDDHITQVLSQKKIQIKRVKEVTISEALQRYLLDSVGPMAHIYSACQEAITSRSHLDPHQIGALVTTALKFIGNANCQANFYRQKSVLEAINPALAPYAMKKRSDPDSVDLFGPSLRSRMKEGMEWRKDVEEFDKLVREPYRKRPRIEPRQWRPPLPYGQPRVHRYQPRAQGPHSQQFQRKFNRPYTAPKDGNHSTETTSQFNWKNTRSGNVHGVCASAYSQPASRSYICPENIKLEVQCSSIGGKQEGINLVDHPHHSNEPCKTNTSRTNISHRIRCVSNRVGSTFRRYHDRGSLDTNRFGFGSPYKLSRAESSPSSTPISDQGNGKSFSVAAVGQPNSSCLYQENGRYTLQEIERGQHSNLGILHPNGHLAKSGISARERELVGGLGVSQPQGLERLETESYDFPSNNGYTSMQRGHVCFENQFSTKQVLELAPGPTCGGDRRILCGLESQQVLPFPPIFPYRKVHSGVSTTESDGSIDCSSLAEPTMVPPTHPIPNDVANTTSASRQSVNEPARDYSSNGEVKNITTGSLANLRVNELPAQVRELMEASIRPRTQKSYKSAWNTFSCWCRERGTDAISASITDVVCYLGSLVEKGNAYRTINLHRSAISHFLPKVDHSSVGEHPDVKKILRGIFNSNPPVPKYTALWDVSTVVRYIDGLSENKDLSLKELSEKLVTLLCLTNADRSSDITCLDIQGLTYTPEGVVFKTINLRKTSRPGHLVDSFYGKYEDNPNLCIVLCVRDYLERTALFRKHSKLVLSYVKPHKPVSSATVARWIKSTLLKAGIDTNVFQAHSIRGAATTKAKSSGISIREIQERGDWTSESTFTRFYYRPKHSTGFAKAVLDCKL